MDSVKNKVSMMMFRSMKNMTSNTIQ